MLPECRRTLTYVDCNLKDSAFDHPHEFALSIRRFLEMKTTQYAKSGLALVVLNESDFTHIPAEILFRKRFEKISAMIAEHLRFDNHRTVYCCLYYVNHKLKFRKL